jgi:hypothetical protein
MEWIDRKTKLHASDKLNKHQNKKNTNGTREREPQRREL